MNYIFKTLSFLVKCENGQESYDVGDSFSVKTPAKAADIIVAIDQHKFNEPVYKELVQPMISQITTELNAKGIKYVFVLMVLLILIVILSSLLVTSKYISLVTVSKNKIIHLITQLPAN